MQHKSHKSVHIRQLNDGSYHMRASQNKDGGEYPGQTEEVESSHNNLDDAATMMKKHFGKKISGLATKEKTHGLAKRP